MASDHYGAWLSTATALFFTWALLTLFVRLWVKLRHRETWQLDDWSISLAFVFALCHISVTFAAVNAGFGSSDDSEVTEQEKFMYAGQVLYIITVGVSKVSTSLFVARLTRYRPQIRAAHGMSAVSGVWILASFIAVAARGSIASPWTVADGSRALYIRWIIIEVFGLLIEIALFALAFNLVWGLNMAKLKRFTILAAFACRLLLIPIVAVRLYLLSPQAQARHPSIYVVAQIVTEAVLEYALISASITCLKPFLRPFHSGYIVDSVGAAGSGVQTNVRPNSKDPYYMLGNVSSTTKDGTLVSTRQRDINGIPILRGDFETTQFATAEGGEDVEVHRPARHSDGPMVIEETKTFVVSRTQA